MVVLVGGREECAVDEWQSSVVNISVGLNDASSRCHALTLSPVPPYLMTSDNLRCRIGRISL
jgi:hypothetical protein